MEIKNISVVLKYISQLELLSSHLHLKIGVKNLTLWAKESKMDK